MTRKIPTAEDGAEAVRRLLAGLARGDDVFGLAAAVATIRACADRMILPVPAFVQQLSAS